MATTTFLLLGAEPPSASGSRQNGTSHQFIKPKRRTSSFCCVTEKSTLSTSTDCGQPTVEETQKSPANREFNAQIAGLRRLCKGGLLKDAMSIFNDIPVRSDSYALLFQSCANLKSRSEGQQLHAHMLKSGNRINYFTGIKLVSMYAKCGSLVDARLAFDKLPERTVPLWNAMIREYVTQGHCEEALALYKAMQKIGIKPDNSTFSSVLKACAAQSALQQGQEIHDCIAKGGLESDVYVDNALISMYVKCGRVVSARQVFEKMSERDVVSWNAMIVGYAQNGNWDAALELFGLMQTVFGKADSVTVTSVLSACANLSALQRGKEIHDYIIRNGLESDVSVSNALVAMYARCECKTDARHVFDKMSQRGVVSWNAMIAGCFQNGNSDEAFQLFCQMQLGGTKPNIITCNAMLAGYVKTGNCDEALKLIREMQLAGLKFNLVTFVSVLPACAHLAVLQQGKEIHGYIIRSGFEANVFVGSALVDMYAKCGSIEDARQVFDIMSDRNAVVWTAMIAGNAMHGHGEHSLTLLKQMQRAGIKPDHVTFTAVLTACSHAGLVDEGWQCFTRMSQDYHIIPGLKHYACMVDLLGRAGRLDEAHKFIKSIPVEANNASVWGALLSACRIHCNTELGEHVAEHLFELEPENIGNYVLLANIYAAAGRWNDVAKVRRLMKERGLKTRPGCSWIEVMNRVHAFTVGDRSHPQTEKIYKTLESFARQMKDAGYLPDTNFVLHDVDKEKKEHVLWAHSEKLAISFGLLNTCPGAPIRIAKNLRMCGDCHNFTKFISKTACREVIVRDTNRFHHFKEGLCSCGDYW